MQLKSIIIEAGYSRIMQVLAGKVPAIKSYGMMTAENPNAKKLSPEENKKRNDQLEDYLKKNKLGFVKVKGKFGGNSEHSYLIANPTQDQVQKLGKEFGQESVIFGKENEDGEMVHHYIEGDKVISKRKTFHQLASDVSDMYSQVKGRKFEIPFFDPDAEHEKFSGGKITKDEPKSAENKPHDHKDKVKLLTPSGKKVWVHKSNVNKYEKLGYKQSTK